MWHMVHLWVHNLPKMAQGYLILIVLSWVLLVKIVSVAPALRPETQENLVDGTYLE